MPPPRLPRRRRRRTGRRAAAVAALVVGFPVLAAGPASAHTELRSSSPRAGASVAGVTSVDLWFTEPIDAAASHVWLADAAGYLPLGPATSVGDDHASLSVPVPPVGEGRYDVVWHVVAGDGAVVRGTVPFELTTTAAAPATAGDPAAPPEPTRPVAGPAPHGHGATALTGTLARALLDASLATLIGGLAFVATVWPQGARLARTRRLLWAAAGVAALASIELAAVQYASASGLGIGDALSPSHQWEALQVRSGRLAVARVALLGLSALLAARLSRRRGPLPPRAVIGTATAVLAFGLAETMVLAGHASERGALAAGARLVHVLGVSAWVGGLVMLLCVVVPRRGADEMLAVLPRFSALATGAVAAVTVGGTVLAVDLVGAAGALPSTGYGRVLLAKLAVVALLLLAASVSRRNVRTSLAAGSVARPVAVWVGTEVGLLALVLGLTAVLVSQAPPG